MSRNLKNKLPSGWFKSSVIKGRGIARTLNYPTVNLKNSSILSSYEVGVYACFVEIEKAFFKGLLYYGPRLILGEKKKIIEIYIFNFDKSVYGKKIGFRLVSYLRGVKNFANSDKFKEQLQSDVKKATKLFSNNSQNTSSLIQ